MADASLFIKDLWYFAFHGSFLKKGKLVPKEILGENQGPIKDPLNLLDFSII